MASEDANAPKCDLEGDGCVRLSSILQAFGAPIREEQAWAVCYQTSKCMCKEWTADNRGCYCLTDTSQLRIHKDGSVHSSTVRELGPASTRPIATSEYKLVCSLGLVLFHALEYGLRPDEEHVLSRPFEMLLDRMTSADPEASSDAELSSDDDSGEEDCHDEGIEKDSGEDDPGGGDGGAGKSPHRAGLTLAKVLEMCASHLQTPTQADLHYKAVCRALVAEAVELSTFLQKISSGTKDFIKCHRSDPDTSDLDGLQFQDWAMLWMQVIRELRQGVKLKKVDVETHLHPVEYELTPYEMLLDDIRSQRYKLNKVMVNGDLPPRVKKDAHALILEFIRSRPPLFPVSRRKLKPAPRRETSVHDRLMADIRQPQMLRPVRKRSSSSNSGRRAAQASAGSKLMRPDGALLAMAQSLRRVMVKPSSPIRAVVCVLSGIGRFGSRLGCNGKLAQARNRAIPVLPDWPIFRKWRSSSSSAQWRKFLPWPRALSRSPRRSADVAEGAAASSSSPPQGAQREQRDRGGVDADVRRPRHSQVRVRSYGSTSSLYLEMKDRGAESDEDVGLGLDFEEDDDEFRKCIEDDVPVETSRTKLEDTDSTPQPRRRLIMADISLHLSSSFDEDDLDDAPTSPVPEQPHSLPVQLRRTPQRPTKLQWQHKHGSGDNPDVPTTALLKHKLERRHSITVCESPSRAPYRIAQEMLRRPDKLALNARQESGKENWTTTQWENSMECLSLTLEEVVHIRNVLTKAELESLLTNRPLYEDVEKRKVCFTCKKTKFSFFRPWGVKCKLCERKICDKCSTKMHIPTDRFDRIPVYMLCPTVTEEESPNHSPLPVAFQFTSGSAPSSPILNRPAGATFNTKLNVTVYAPPSTAPPRPRVPKLRHASSVCSPKIGGSEDAAGQEALTRRAPLLRSRTFQHKASSPQEERLRGPLMTVCRDCKGMIRQIILASRTDMAKSQRKACKPPLCVVCKN
ncbi:protein spire homolog 1 isoform X1 [Dermacentor silvarum]|uniref:protein spire homolog 1 isoform X1 n=1 Tax=Dermacentor silvarum TaxID=543639 RepID=UPI002101C988|nr:protein spire homolog 1 isoform X1 [Dermacentor silvarum]